MTVVLSNTHKQACGHNPPIFNPPSHTETPSKQIFKRTKKTPIYIDTHTHIQNGVHLGLQFGLLVKQPLLLLLASLESHDGLEGEVAHGGEDKDRADEEDLGDGAHVGPRDEEGEVSEGLGHLKRREGRLLVVRKQKADQTWRSLCVEWLSAEASHVC